MRYLPILASVVLLTIASSIHAQPSVRPATSGQDVATYAAAAAADPLTPTAKEQRHAAMSYAENDHSSHVLLCVKLFQQMSSLSTPDGHEISLQYVISAAGFLYQHPDAAADSTAQNLAGIDAALQVYEKFLAANPKNHVKILDSLDKEKADGKLKEAITKMCK